MSYRPDHLHIATDARQLFDDCAHAIVDYARQCVAASGSFSMALAGGSTPQQLYLQLSKPPLLEQMPWQSSQFYFGDERMVPHDHADSNFAMAKRALFDRAPVPHGNIHPVPTDCMDAAQCAERYAQEVAGLDGFDLVLLGMGTDGHTASLFPDTDILQESQRLATAVYVSKLDSWRISLTYPCINRSRRIIVLAQGKGKKAIIDAIFHSTAPGQYPVTRLRPHGPLTWYVDREACPQTTVTPD